jgi:hypothetical protein
MEELVVKAPNSGPAHCHKEGGVFEEDQRSEQCNDDDKLTPLG